MRIEITGGASICRQARIYAGTGCSATLSEVIDTSQVRSASLILRRAKSRRGEGVACGERVTCTSPSR